jgi:hypothetical protein
VTERSNIVEWRQPVSKCTIEIDAELYRDTVNLLVDLLLDRADGLQNDTGFLLRHAARMSLVLCEMVCGNNTHARNLNS